MDTLTSSEHPTIPLVSVIVLNYNGARWLERCLQSLRQQTIFDRIEVIVADNASPDRSDQLAAALMKDWPNGQVMQHGQNLGFCEGNNRAADGVRGNYLFFLNNDTWMEPNCLETLVVTVERMGASAGTPLMLNYDENTIQSSGGSGFDIFGLMSLAKPHVEPRDMFVAGGCSYLIKHDLFERVGKFDREFFMYADEYDLSWRVWIAGAKIISVPAARLHHRGSTSVNPKGDGEIVELRTSDTKRYYTNRNCLLVLLKNCEHLLLLLVPLQLGLLCLEAGVFLLLVRRWSFLKRAYWNAVLDCWRLRQHVLEQRRQIHEFRRRSDWRMLRFFQVRLNRWDGLQLLGRHGLPKVTQD